jgi:Ca2+-transporting ATPase
MERKIDNAAPNAVGTTGTLSRPRTGALPQNLRFAFPAGSIEDRVSRYLESAGGGSMKVNLDRVGFERGSSTLTPQSRRQVENLAAILRAYPKATVVVAGHTDNIGSAADNLALSRARAESVARALTNAGVAADRVRAEGYGSQLPMADNSTEDGRSQNRRVTLEVSR